MPRHDNPDGPCECGAWHMLEKAQDREQFSKEVIKENILHRIHGHEEKIEEEFREIRNWLEILEDPP